MIDHELVAADPSHRVDRARGGQGKARQGDEHAIAGLVAQAIVRALELVDVDVGQRDLVVEAPAALDLSGGDLAEGAPVGRIR